MTEKRVSPCVSSCEHDIYITDMFDDERTVSVRKLDDERTVSARKYPTSVRMRRKQTRSSKRSARTETSIFTDSENSSFSSAACDGEAFKFSISSLPCDKKKFKMDLSDIYDIIHLTDGSNSHIFQGVFGSSRKPVIIKTIAKSPRNEDNAIREFALERDVLMRFSHPNIVQYIGSGRDNGRAFIVLEMLQGGALSKMLHAHIASGDKNAPFSYQRVLEIALSFARALHYIHYKFNDNVTIVHRDLKPDNIAFTDGGVLKLIDFGLCTVVRRRTSPHETYAMTGKTGSARYMAPEVHMWQPYTELVDVYSFGLVMWQVATGLVPFGVLSTADCKRRIVLNRERPPLQNIMNDSTVLALPQPFTEILGNCWHWQPEKRPQSSQLVELFSAMLKEQVAAKSSCRLPSWLTRSLG